jgi:hypothetical protein
LNRPPTGALRPTQQGEPAVRPAPRQLTARYRFRRLPPLGPGCYQNLVKTGYRADGLAGLDHLHHLGPQTAGTTFTIQSHQDETGSTGHISPISRETGLVIEAIRPINKLTAMVSALVTGTGWCRLDNLSRKGRTGWNSRAGARKGKGCQGFLRIRRNDQAAGTKSVNKLVTITKMVSAFERRWKLATHLFDQTRHEKGSLRPLTH